MLPIARVPFYPFYGLRSLLDREEECTPSIASSIPSVNIAETDTEYRIEVAAPGMKREDMTIDLKDRLLSIRGEQKAEQEESQEGRERSFLRREFHYRTFSKRFTLPEGIDPEGIGAAYENGVLTVRIPKQAPRPDEGKRLISIQ